MAGASPRHLAAQLELSSAVGVPGGELVYAVLNTGDLPLMLGAHYSLDHAVGDGWQPVELGLAFRAWGRRMQPGDRAQLIALLPGDLPAGRYRLRKQLRAYPEPHRDDEWVARVRDAPIEATAEFDVEPAPD